MKPEIKFFEAIEITAFDESQRALLEKRLRLNKDHVENAKFFYADLELARTRASFIKSRMLDNLDKYLIEFEANFTKKGGKVIWAQNGEEAISEIIKIIEKKEVKKIIKSRSQIFEELVLSAELKPKGIEIEESDIGNYIQSLAGENSFHPLFPTLHQTLENCKDILKSKINIDDTLSAQQLTDIISESIRKEFKNHQISISSANFLVADAGAAIVMENEANVAQLTSVPKTQLFIAGIEDMLPTLNDADLFLHLFSTHSSGSTAYTHIISGPKISEESDGADEMYVILLDNGRSEVLAKTKQRSALACIKCGACYNVCPVYKNIGGHAYQAVYNGPIGSIITPLMFGMENYKYLSFASPSCMECLSECPVKIDFPNLLQQNRTDSIKLSPPGKTEKLAIFFWKTAMLKRSTMDKGGAKLKNFMLRQFFKKSWGERREMPCVSQKSFNQIWRERKGIK